MHVFYYDKSFEGLLSAVFDAYTLKRFPVALLAEGDIPPLTAGAGHQVVSDPAKADRVFAGLRKKLSPEGRDMLLHCWLAEEPGGDMLLFRVMRKIFDTPRLIEKDFSDPDILAASQLARKVTCDAHLLLGFVRFQQTAEGIYFAAIEPRHNVLPLLLPHFADRFADQDWIIYDCKRHYGTAYDKGAFRDVTLDEQVLSNGKLPVEALAEGEAMFQELWKGYFAATAISERYNPRLQSRCMPRRFWPHMTEKQG